jgi:hypothetical protein
VISAESLRKSGWLAYLVVVLFMALGPSKLPNYWLAYFFGITLMLAWTWYLIYWSEKYTTYMVSLLSTVIGSFAFLACNGAYVAMSGIFGKGSITALAAGLGPALFVMLAYLAVISTKPSFHPFEYDGRKVQTRGAENNKPSRRYRTGLIAGITTLAGGVFLKYFGMLTATVVASVVLTTCCLTMLFQMRHVIRGLRALRVKEQGMPTPYTFMRIEEIREARGRWWCGRFLKWVTSLRSSSGA